MTSQSFGRQTRPSIEYHILEQNPPDSYHLSTLSAKHKCGAKSKAIPERRAARSEDDSEYYTYRTENRRRSHLSTANLGSEKKSGERARDLGVGVKSSRYKRSLEQTRQFDAFFFVDINLAGKCSGKTIPVGVSYKTQQKVTSHYFRFDGLFG